MYSEQHNLLKNAIDKNNIEKIKNILNNDKNIVYELINNEYYFLDYTLYDNTVHIFAYFIEQYNFENIIYNHNSNGENFLHKAINNNSYNIVIYLITKFEMFLHLKDKNNLTCLHHAVVLKQNDLIDFKRLQIIKLLIKKYHDLINHTDNDGNTCLHYAILNTSDNVNNYTIINYLIEKYPELIEKKNNLGKTCLHLATYINKKKIVKLILSKNNNVIWIKNNENMPIIHDIVNSYFVLNNQLENISKNKLNSEIYNKVEIINYIIDKYPSTIYLFDSKNNTCLQTAILVPVYNDNMELYNRSIISYLIRKYPNLIYNQNVNGNTCLHYAIKMFKYYIVHLLIKNYIDLLHIKNNNNVSPYDMTKSDDLVNEFVDFEIMRYFLTPNTIKMFTN